MAYQKYYGERRVWNFAVPKKLADEMRMRALRLSYELKTQVDYSDLVLAAVAKEYGFDAPSETAAILMERGNDDDAIQ